ncbi:MAG: DUF4299 family protein [Oceanivirga sp.]|nr:DUF4299 family protein [Oceanivirga sp.]
MTGESAPSIQKTNNEYEILKTYEFEDFIKNLPKDKYVFIDANQIIIEKGIEI